MPITLTTTLSGASEVTQGSVTFTLDTSYAVGNYADGPAYIVAPSGCTINSVTPAQTTLSSEVINGAMKNPTVGDAQAFDERATVTFTGANGATYPLAMAAGDVLVKAVSNTTAGITSGLGSSTRTGLCDEFAAVFVVATEPAANEISPAAVSWTGRTEKTSYVVDVPAFVAALTSYNTTGQTPTAYADIIGAIGQYAPVAFLGGNNSTFYQEFLPRGFGLNGGASFNYGGNVNELMNPACLALISDGYTTAQKEAIALALISNGNQWYNPISDGVSVGPNGGHFQFHLGAMACALQATSRSKATLVADAGINFTQAFQFSSAQAAELVNHTVDGDPFTWRERVVTAVSGTNVTVQTTQSIVRDPTQVSFVDLVLTRVSDAATANVSAQGTATAGDGGTLIASNTTDTMILTIDAQPGSPFLVNDVVYLATPFTTPTTGDFEWAINGTQYFNFYNPSPSAVYRDVNKWTGQVAFLKATGWAGDFSAVYGYVERANAANDPAGYDFPEHHATTWESEFWSQHAATIFA